MNTFFLILCTLALLSAFAIDIYQRRPRQGK